MKKTTLKKALMLSFGVFAIAGTIASIAVACRPESGKKGGKENGSGGTGGNQGGNNEKVHVSPKYVQEYRQPTVSEINELRSQWRKDVEAFPERLNKFIGDKSVYTTQPKLATLRTGASLTTEEALYAFGIAPDYIHYKWNDASLEVAVPSYLEGYYDPSKSKSWNGKAPKEADLKANQIGVLVTTAGNISGTEKFVTSKAVGAVIAQSRTASIPSKAPYYFSPKELFGPENKNLEHKVDAHAGSPIFLADPYEGIIFTAKMLDKVYDAKEFSPVHNANVDGQTNFNTFEEYARAYVKKVRTNVATWAKENTAWNNKKVLVFSPNVQPGSGASLDTNFAENGDGFVNTRRSFIMQPVYFSGLYGSKDDPETPGLGALFPQPISHLNDIQKYVDDYGWIGGKSLVSDGREIGDTISKNISDAFKGTSDYVIYSYNQYLLKGWGKDKANNDKLAKEYEDALTKFINDENNKSKLPFTNALKGKPVVGKNVFIVRKDQWHDASYGFIGQQTAINYLDMFYKQSLGQEHKEIELGVPKFTPEQTMNIRAFKK
ncbi:Vmc-like lipoprotein signal peptide domain-containing protein [Ureaplasma canigenitalium]|uniref:Vmc-like lipoprotein signal peptide domain-containing protein n=1 Tax=Ureaplasma canigenitalium TaxID=42092 RepID=UPI0006915691|nr:hypothetical protein [Ureaplasma canigenitalium]